MGLPIMVQLTESERNKLHPGDGYDRLRLYIYRWLNGLRQESESSTWSQRTTWSHAVSFLSGQKYHVKPNS